MVGFDDDIITPAIHSQDRMRWQASAVDFDLDEVRVVRGYVDRALAGVDVEAAAESDLEALLDPVRPSLGADEQEQEGGTQAGPEIIRADADHHDLLEWRDPIVTAHPLRCSAPRRGLAVPKFFRRIFRRGR